MAACGPSSGHSRRNRTRSSAVASTSGVRWFLSPSARSRLPLCPPHTGASARARRYPDARDAVRRGRVRLTGRESPRRGTGRGETGEPVAGSARGNDSKVAPAPPSRPRKPNISDVAQTAGVSYQTVSRVLNNAPDVSAATRERVQRIIKDMGYRRSRTATALSTSRSTAIGILTDGSPRFGPVGTLMALEKVARQKGYFTTVVTVEEPYEDSVPKALDTLDDIEVDGIIVIAPLLSMAEAVRGATIEVPVEMIAAGASSTPNLFTYSENQELGARMATQHLIELGHTDIAHLAGSDRKSVV